MMPTFVQDLVTEGRVEIQGENLVVKGHASAVATFGDSEGEVEFTASYPEFGEHVAADLGVELTEAFTYMSGEVRAGSGRVLGSTHEDPIFDDISLVCWRGRNYSVHFHLYNQSVESALTTLEHFRIRETGFGIRVQPKRPRGRLDRTRPDTLLVEMEDLGLLRVLPMTTSVARSMPRRQGTQLRGGELFIDEIVREDESGRQTHAHRFLMVADTAAVWLHPNDPTLHHVPQSLEDLRVVWRSS